VIAVLITTPVAAHNGATGIVKERMDGMVLLGKAMKELTAVAAKRADFDDPDLRVMSQRLPAQEII